MPAMTNRVARSARWESFRQIAVTNPRTSIVSWADKKSKPKEPKPESEQGSFERRSGEASPRQ